MSGLAEYMLPAKESWRRWQWEQIGRRLPEREGVILYLRGPDDRDAWPATSAGVRALDLIAIDHDLGTVKAARRRGRLAIHGDLGDVVAAWPEHTPVNAVVADYCSGLVKSTSLLATALMFSPGVDHRTVVSVNLLRGRDAWSNGFRGSLADAGSDETKHRGKVWVNLAFCAFCQVAAELMGRPVMRGLERGRLPPVLKDLQAHIRDAVSDCEYKSGPQWFDSVVLSWPMNLQHAADQEFDPKMVRRIAATLAHRTRRMS